MIRLSVTSSELVSALKLYLFSTADFWVIWKINLLAFSQILVVHVQFNGHRIDVYFSTGTLQHGYLYGKLYVDEA
jgi:hypothetical protein